MLNLVYFEYWIERTVEFLFQDKFPRHQKHMENCIIDNLEFSLSDIDTVIWRQCNVRMWKDEDDDEDDDDI